MRIYKLLVEKQINPLNVIAKYIAKNCKPFLNQVDEQIPPLYRGQSDWLTKVTDKLFQSATLKNRQPKDTLIKDHAIIDQWFLDQFGIRFRSNHIMFATGARSVGFYGNPYSVIPISNFQFCWSPTITDTIDLIPKAYEYEIPDANKLDRSYKYEVKKEMIEELLERGGYSVTDLNAAINSGNEVMIHCKEYYLLDVTDDEYKQIIKMAKEM
jgi:hypothetical protein